MVDTDLKRKNTSSNTALCLVPGHVNIAKIQMAKHKARVKMPRHLAAVSGKHDTNSSSWTDKSRGDVLLACVEAEQFDVAQKIVNDCPELAVSERSILRTLAGKPHAFRKKYNLIQKYFYEYDRYDGHVDEGNQAVQLLRTILANIPKHKLDDMLRGPAYQIKEEISSSSVLFVAAESGNTVFIAELIRHYPRRVVELNDNKQSIFHVAVLYRHVGVYNLLHDIGSIKDSIITLEDKNGNNLLHLVGFLKDSIISNQSQFLKELALAVHMERERQWFMMVRDMLPPSLREKKNKAGLRPRELFTKNHKDLYSRAVTFVEKTSLKVVVVASALATISCGIDIGFVGGYKQETGKPMIPRKNFNWSRVCNGISLLLTYTSIFLALSIARSSYADRDFFSSSLHKLKSIVVVLGMPFMLQALAFLHTFIRLFQYISLKIPYLLLIPSVAVLFLFRRIYRRL